MECIQPQDMLCTYDVFNVWPGVAWLAQGWRCQLMLTMPWVIRLRRSLVRLGEVWHAVGVLVSTWLGLAKLGLTWQGAALPGCRRWHKLGQALPTVCRYGGCAQLPWTQSQSSLGRECLREGACLHLVRLPSCWTIMGYATHHVAMSCCLS